MAIGECFEPQDYCRYPEPFSDIHHEYGPESAFKTDLEIAFRALFTRQECRCRHEALEPQYLPKPSPIKMAQEVAKTKKGERRINEIGFLLDRHFAQQRRLDEKR